MAENEKAKKVLGFIKSDLWIVILDVLAVSGAYLLALNARFIGNQRLYFDSALKNAEIGNKSARILSSNALFTCQMAA